MEDRILASAPIPSCYAQSRRVMEKAKLGPILRTAIVQPCDKTSLLGMVAAYEAGLIVPILVGNIEEIQAAAQEAGVAIANYEIIAAKHSHAAAAKAIELARNGEVDALMKGSLHTDELMAAVVDDDHGLRTDRRMSHAYVIDVPFYKWPLMITDAALNIAPSLTDKLHICQNAIYLAHDLGVPEPKVAILGATEQVCADMPATIDAAGLCKMAERGQITGGVLDGPLALDVAINAEAASVKGVTSMVAGYADILVVPSLDAGNMLAKGLKYFSAANVAGLVLGARVPIILTSRADDAQSHVVSAALAILNIAGEKARARAKSAPTQK